MFHSFNNNANKFGYATLRNMIGTVSLTQGRTPVTTPHAPAPVHTRELNF